MPRQKKATRPVPDWKALVSSDRDFLRSIITEVLNEVMEAEMTVSHRQRGGDWA